MFSWETEVLVGLVSNHVVGHATNEGYRGLSNTVGEKPRETKRSLLRVAGEINGTEISLVCTGDELDGGGLVKDGREGV